MEKNWKKWKEDRQIDDRSKNRRRKREDKKKKLENRTFLWRRNLKRGIISRSWTVDFIFIFFFFFFLLFSILEQLGLGFISHAVISVTS